MPNAFAYLVLFSYPLVVVVLFKRLALHIALVWSVVLGYLFLPQGTEIDLPVLPALDRNFIPILVAGLMCLAVAQKAGPRTRSVRHRGPDRSPGKSTVVVRQSKLANFLIVLLLIAPFGVVLTNTEAIMIGPRFLPGIRLYDSLSMILNALVMVLPFIVARRYLGTAEAHYVILRVLVITGLIYSLIALFEARMSPQLHTWIYGFFQHDFLQHIRRGGFRPVGFLPHGLSLGLYLLLTILAAAALFRLGRAQAKQGQQIRGTKTLPRGVDLPDAKGAPIWLSFYLLGILWIAKSLGAFIVALALLPIILLTNPAQWRYVSAGIAVLVLLYPMARSVGAVPVDQILEWANQISVERAESLQFRLRNEDLLLARAAEQPVFGWGGYGRSETFNPFTGGRLTVVDGIWVGVFGTSGWVGYLGTFGLLTLPIFLFFFAPQDLRQSITSQALCLILAANLIDLLPNAGLTPITWMLAGALLGRYERQSTPQHRPNTRQQRVRAASRELTAAGLKTGARRSVR